MSYKDNHNEKLNLFEEALSSLRPRKDRLGDSWRSLLTEEAARLDRQNGETPILETFPVIRKEWLGIRRLSKQVLQPKTRHSETHSAQSLNTSPRILGNPRREKLSRATQSLCCVTAVVCILLVGAWLWNFADSSYLKTGAQMAVAVEKNEMEQDYVAKCIRNVRPTFVGRVTNLAGCRWVSGVSPVSRLDRVVSGQLFRLEAGLLEITYDNGSTVLLKGPVDYEVCTNGGYLASGSLVGKLADKTSHAKQNTKDEPQENKTDIRVPPCTLAIRTPTVGVVDLGTEFGVKVEKNCGSTVVHVFRGSVALCSLNDVIREPYLVLKENKSVQFDLTDQPEPKQELVTIDPNIFERDFHEARKTPSNIKRTQKPAP